MNSAARVALLTIVIGCLIGSLTAIGVPPGAGSKARVLSLQELQQSLGGSCPDRGCENKTCATTGCSSTEQFCTKVASTTKCRKTLKNNYARCGAKGSKTGFTCTESSGNGCVTIKVGDQVPGQGGAPATCPETACDDDGGSCGDTWFTCTATACPT